MTPNEADWSDRERGIYESGYADAKRELTEAQEPAAEAMSDIKAVVVPRDLYYHEIAYVRGLEAEVKATLDIAAGYLETIAEQELAHIALTKERDEERQRATDWRGRAAKAADHVTAADARVQRLTEALTEVQDMVSTEMRWMKVIREVIDAALARQSTEPKP